MVITSYIFIIYHNIFSRYLHNFYVIYCDRNRILEIKHQAVNIMHIHLFEDLLLRQVSNVTI